MENLYGVDSPIDRERRKNLNDTFADILRRFNNLQMQINILSGDASVEEILAELTEAINNANSTVAELQSLVADSVESSETAIQTAIDNYNNELAAQLTVIADRLTTMQNAIDDAETATDAANTATANTTSAINDARQAITDINNLIASMSYKGEYNASTTYNTNNIVRYGKSSFVSLKTQNGIAPSDDGVNWRLLAVGGIDGQGAVNTVNGTEPDESGNVNLNVPSSQEFNDLEVGVSIINSSINDIKEEKLSVNAIYKKELYRQLPLRFADYQTIVDREVITYIYPQSFTVDWNRNEIFILYSPTGGASTKRWIVVFDLETTEYKRSFHAGNAGGEGIVIKYEGENRYLYVKHSGTLLGKYLINTLPANLTSLTAESTYDVGLFFNFSYRNGIWIIEQDGASVGTNIRRTSFTLFNNNFT
ncbi:MAG: hypothetical protein ABS939_17720, partial [Psychrobacillus sp.]